MSDDKEDLLSLFDQYSDLMSPTLAWLSTGITIVINEASPEGISAETTLHFNSSQQQHWSTQVPTCQSYHNSFSTPQELKLLQSNKCTVTSSSCTDVGPIWQCYLTFKLGNKYFTDKVIFLSDLHKDLVLRLNWQFNYKIGCNWNINGHQYMVHNINYLYTSIALKVTKPIIWNAGAFYLQSRSVSVITIQAPRELDPQHIYELTFSDDLPYGLISLSVDHKVKYEYPKLLSIPVLNNVIQ